MSGDGARPHGQRFHEGSTVLQFGTLKRLKARFVGAMVDCLPPSPGPQCHGPCSPHMQALLVVVPSANVPPYGGNTSLSSQLVADKLIANAELLPFAHSEPSRESLIASIG